MFRHTPPGTAGTQHQVQRALITQGAASPPTIRQHQASSQGAAGKGFYGISDKRFYVLPKSQLGTAGKKIHGYRQHAHAAGAAIGIVVDPKAEYIHRAVLT